MSFGNTAPAPGNLRLADAQRHEQHDGAPEAVEAWLDVFERMLRLPAGQKDAIREELRSHLTERVRDLMLAGMSRDQAMQHSLGELGEAAELAERFRHANQYPRRRRLMHGAIIGLGAAAALAATAIFTRGPSGGIDSAVFDAPAERQADISTLKSVAITVHAHMSLKQILQSISDSRQLGVRVDWGRLEQVGIHGDEPLGFSGEGVSVFVLLNELSERYDMGHDSIDWRLQENKRLVIDLQSAFDLRERVLASFDISAVLAAMHDQYGIEYEDAADRISSVITGLVEPEKWFDNGGEVGQLYIVSGRMFVNAPLRMQEKVSWMIGELAKGSIAPPAPPMTPSAAGPGVAPLAGPSAPNEPSIMPNPSPEERAAHANNQLVMSALRNIHMACQIWAQANDDPLTSLDQLVTGGMLTPQQIASPAGPAQVGGDYWIDFPAATDPNPDVDWSQRVVGIDRACFINASQAAVLFADGHVELLLPEQLRTVLGKSANRGVKLDLPGLEPESR